MSSSPQQRIGLLIQKNCNTIDELVKRVTAIEAYIESDQSGKDLPQVVCVYEKGQMHEVLNEPDETDISYIDELLKKLISIQEESSLLEEELKSMREMDEELDKQDEEDNKTVSTDNTEICQELINAEPEQDRKVINPCLSCKQCIKAKGKQLKRDKRQAEKERMIHVKEIKRKQKEILILEQQELSNKLSNFRRGIDALNTLTALDRDVINNQIVKISTKIDNIEL